MDIKDISVPRDELSKFVAAYHAAAQVRDGMTIGLGTGTTAFWFIVLLGQRIQNDNLQIRGIPTSSQTAELSMFHDIPLTSFNEVREIDITVDGADEISSNLELIKGGGAALLKEKIVANASNSLIIIADESKLVDGLGKFPLPVEVAKFGWQSTAEKITELLRDTNSAGDAVEIRRAGMGPRITDENHYLLDCYCETIPDPAGLAQELNTIPGVVENGLFVNYADKVYLGDSDGNLRIIDLSDGDLGLTEIDLPIDLEIED